MEHKRIDVLLTEKGLAKSRTAAAALIKEGSVTVNGAAVRKPSEQCPETAEITVSGDSALTKYVGRGGLKLETAIEAFVISPRGCVCLDIGASTGGFTDCMLQNGALRVYAVDVGTGQLDSSLLADSRVISLENTDIRSADSSLIPEKVTFVSCDVSFISLKAVLPEIKRFTAENAVLAALIKPQFELGRAKLGKSGVVRDPKLHEKAVRDITEFAGALGFTDIRTIPSKITGGDGNREFLMHCIIP
ncbi:MAG: TlyA family RNA methyltransferase [Ruminiclostridium sp.]|nr:TlyA family RNA methyltransferase [Ruminiclostridium sp.]